MTWLLFGKYKMIILIKNEQWKKISWKPITVWYIVYHICKYEPSWNLDMSIKVWQTCNLLFDHNLVYSVRTICTVEKSVLSFVEKKNTFK